MKLISSRDNPQFRTLQKLARSAKERHSSRMMLLDGDHLIEAARDAGVHISLLVIGESAMQHEARRNLFESTPASTRVVLTDPLLDTISPVSTASGLVAVASIPETSTDAGVTDSCLLLEAIQDPGNLGTILRTAAAAGIRQVAISSGAVSAWSPKVLRAGMGAHFRLSIQEQADLNKLARGYPGRIIVTLPAGGASLYETDLSSPIAWLFGNEGAGVTPELAQLAAHSISIPMPGPTESLNVASAVAICLFEELRQKRAKV